MDSRAAALVVVCCVPLCRRPLFSAGTLRSTHPPRNRLVAIFISVRVKEDATEGLRLAGCVIQCVPVRVIGRCVVACGTPGVALCRDLARDA